MTDKRFSTVVSRAEVRNCGIRSRSELKTVEIRVALLLHWGVIPRPDVQQSDLVAADVQQTNDPDPLGCRYVNWSGHMLLIQGSYEFVQYRVPCVEC
jgi:hypothetical protein